MMQDQKLLTLRWRSFLGGGNDITAAIFTYNGAQHFHYSLMSSDSCLIIHDGRTEIIDAPLTLIFIRW